MIDWTAKSDMENLWYYLAQIKDGWIEKIAIGGVITSVFSFFGGNVLIYYIFLGSTIGDFILGALHGKKQNGHISLEKLRKGVLKFVAQSIYIILAGLAGVLLRLADVPIPILNWFVCYLSLSELASVMRHLDYLGMKTPPVLKMFIDKSQGKIKEKIDGGEGKDAK